MIEKAKKAWGVVTVKAAAAAVVVMLLSLYLPWFTYQDMSQSVMQAIHADPDYFMVLLPVVIAGMAWVVGFFLINHPKITLLGDAVLLFVYAALALEGYDRNLKAGIGSYLYLLAVIACIVCAFITKKQKNNVQAGE